jgi:hypothetical protein
MSDGWAPRLLNVGAVTLQEHQDVRATCRRAILSLRLVRGPIVTTVLLLVTATAHAQTVALPSSAITTMMTAAVTEQANISIPSTVGLDVTNVDAQSARPNLTINVSSIVLATATKQLRISVQAAAASFTAPSGAPTTWTASDVGWVTQNWTNAANTDGMLSDAAFNTVATCNAAATSCSTSKLKFTLAPNANIRRSGNYTIGIIWKFESIGT